MQEFDISIDRIDKIPVPLLVVGLGGTGCDALKMVKHTFAERYNLPLDSKGKQASAPIKTAYLGIDSISQRPEEFETNEYLDITVPGMDTILAQQATMLTPEERTWVNHDLRHAASGIGMGTVRQAGRLAVCRNYDKISNGIQAALKSIVATVEGASDSLVNSVEVAVITGIGGGTGSGIFLDIAQIIRHEGRKVTTLPIRITGYIVMPDVSLANVAAAPGMENIIKHNGYAALKELDFWMRVKQHEIPYEMKYTAQDSIKWDNPPFDNCVLMSCSNVRGIPYKNGYEAVLHTIAENLLHYMAAEDVAAQGGIKQAYSYRQYEDNLSRINPHKSKPVLYGYRAIGAFTKRIPKQPILFYEGKLLLETFIPLRDKQGIMQPDRRMFQDGQGDVRAENIIGRGSTLMQNFRTTECKLPEFCNIQLNDNVKVAAVQNLNPPPHNRWVKWRDSVCTPSALRAAEKYLAEAWERFEQFAADVMEDPAQGPFALEAYLSGTNGLRTNLETTLNTWMTKRDGSVKSIQSAEEMCQNSWPNFQRPPILARKKALEEYDHAIRTLYTAVANREFLVYHVEALQKLILRIEEYLRDGLKPVCQCMLRLEKEFGQQDNTDAVLAADIYNLSAVKNSIDDMFAKRNGAGEMSRTFLAELTKISMMTEPSVDAQTSGVTFVSGGSGMGKLSDELQKILKDCFGSVNDQSLDSIMEANVGTETADQQRWMTNLANSVIDSALPMFLQDGVYQSERAVSYGYMSIPVNAPQHLAYITQAYQTHDPKVDPKASELKDHIYCLMAWDKMPMYRYGLMEEMRRQYDTDVNTELGLHLVRTGAADADFTSDWTKLPSPKPYFLFGKHSVPSEMKDYAEVKSLVERGVECKMIEVETSNPFASAKIHLYYDASGRAALTKETLLAKRDLIVAEKDPATGDVCTAEVIAQKLMDFLKTGTSVTLSEPEVRPMEVASVLGLEHSPCDPFDTAVQADIQRLAEAKENHARLCVAMIEALVYSRPDIVQALRMQLPAVEEIYAGAIYIGRANKIWENRVEFAENVADIFVYLNDVISLGMNGYRYKLKGENFEIVNAKLLADDLRDSSSELVKCAAFLADVPENNAAKADLLKMLREAKQDFEESMDGGDLTADDVQALQEAANDLAEDAKADADVLEREARVNPSKADELGHQVELLMKINTTANNRMRVLKKIAKGL